MCSRWNIYINSKIAYCAIPIPVKSILKDLKNLDTKQFVPVYQFLLQYSKC